MEDLVARARQFATEAHSRIDQRRKYSNQPYDVHLKAVASIVSEVTDDPEMIAAAWLHDVVEDTPATFEDIERLFGRPVAALVEELTDVSRPGDGNRAARKKKDLQHTAAASPRGKTIKLADIIDNSLDIARHDPKFARVFLREARDLMSVLGDADAGLYGKAQKVLARCDGLLKDTGSSSSAEPRGSATETGLFDFSKWRVIRDFARVFTAGDLAEPLLSFDGQDSARHAGACMDTSGAAVAGIRASGLVRGFVLRDDLAEGACGARLREFSPPQVLYARATLTDVVHVLTLHEWCFVRAMGEPAGVIGRHDMQKPIVRMWLFGIITLFEQEMAHLIKALWPGDGWAEFLSPARLAKARDLFQERCRRNHGCSLIDCLQLTDKASILMHQETFTARLGFKTGGAVKRVIKDLESLRNNLAHSQDIVTENWAQIVRLARRMEEAEEKYLQ